MIWGADVRCMNSLGGACVGHAPWRRVAPHAAAAVASVAAALAGSAVVVELPHAAAAGRLRGPPPTGPACPPGGCPQSVPGDWQW